MVGIHGLWHMSNYGSVLTYYGLYKYVEKLGYNPIFLHVPGDEQHPFKPSVLSSNFMQLNGLKISEQVSGDKFGEYSNSICNQFIVGADQMWRPQNFVNWGYDIALDFVPENKTRLAYGTSIGTDSFNCSTEVLDKVTKELQMFKGIGCREDSMVHILKDKCGVDGTLVVDPILLLDKEDYYQIAELSKINTNNRYILSYILDPTKEKMDLIKQVEKYLGIKSINVLDAETHFYNRHKEQFTLGNIINPTEQSWLKLIKDAEFIITDSYHGSVVVTLLNKPAFIIKNSQRGLTRFESFETMRGEQFKEHKIDTTILDADYSNINVNINKWRDFSREWLKEKLK